MIFHRTFYHFYCLFTGTYVTRQPRSLVTNEISIMIYTRAFYHRFNYQSRLHFVLFRKTFAEVAKCHELKFIFRIEIPIVGKAEIFDSYAGVGEQWRFGQTTSLSTYGNERVIRQIIDLTNGCRQVFEISFRFFDPRISTETVLSFSFFSFFFY